MAVKFLLTEASGFVPRRTPAPPPRWSIRAFPVKAFANTFDFLWPAFGID